ncbi:MAG: hypothetical protein QF755_05760 [Candidatus Peribacteraceae bacterium]|jgi:hypothetical protein|nr:hypothetical protein [Candidatus Peribacteraceae bacterium]|tara:strand:+ start:167 stop:1147 length:981 start_codon:yes stop_codon:yes gene_type:complete
MRLFSQQLPGKLAIVTTYFNYAGYNALFNNFKIFAEEIRSQELDLWTVEIAFGNDEFDLEKDDRILQIRTPDVMWQKERALNLLIKTLPKEYDKIAWLDADILFENRKWAKEANKLLENHKIIQCFSKAHLYKEGNAKLTKNAHVGYVSQKINPVQKSMATMHPGYAWAGRRNFVERHMLYDRHVLGANDFLMALAFIGNFKHKYITESINESMRNDFRRWANNVSDDIQKNVGYLDGAIRHLWHGKIKNRQYVKRDSYLLDYDFDPEKDIRIGSSGLFEWSSSKPDMHQAVQQYFVDRNDDGNFLSGSTPCFLRNSVSSSSHLVA